MDSITLSLIYPNPVNPALKCEHCYKIFSRKDSLKVHICKGRISPFQCDKCNKVLSSKQVQTYENMQRCKSGIGKGERNFNPKSTEQQ